MLRGLPTGAAAPLIDGHRRLKSSNTVDVRPGQLVQKLPGIDRKRFDVLPLTFGENGVKSERTFAATARPGDDDKPTTRNFERNILEIVDPGTLDVNG